MGVRFTDPPSAGILFNADDKARRNLWPDPTRANWEDRRELLSMAQAYAYLLTHPIGVERCVAKLRELRRALRERDAKCRP